MKSRYIALVIAIALLAAVIAPATAMATTTAWKNVGSVRGISCYVQAQGTLASDQYTVSAVGRSKTSGTLIDSIGSRVYLYNHNVIHQATLLSASAWRYESDWNYENSSCSGRIFNKYVSHGNVRAYGYFYKSGGSALSGVYTSTDVY